MPAAELHFYDADDPNGATIFECSTDDAFVKSIELDIQRDSLGSGKVTFARKVGVGLFTRQIVVPEVLVRVLIPSIHATKYYTGFWINPRQQQVISKDEQGGEGFTFAGPGPKHYLERMILWSASFTGIDSAVDKEAGIWRWPETAVAGRILNRLILEDQANPSGPFLPDLHISFDDTDDSDGNPWTEDVSDADGSFILRISDDYLKLLWTIEDVSGLTSQIYLGEVGNPVIRLDAFQSFGRDLTGPIGASTVHFTEGVNISTDLDVEGSSYRKASHALVRGTDGVYNLAFKPSWSPGDLKKVVGTEFDSNSGAVLDRAGERFLTRQDDGEDQIDLKIITGFDPESGLYMPGPDYIGSAGHFWVGDSISLTTGQSEQTALDYDDDTETVTGIELELEEAVRDDTDEQAARSFAVTVKLNEQRKSNHTARDLAGNRGTVPAPPNVLQLCQAGTFEDSEIEFLGTLGAACTSVGTNEPSDFPAWSGDNEERVQITIPSDVPVGHALIAYTGVQQANWNAEPDTVYDEQGNTWTKDAEHENTGSSSDDTVQIWRCNVTNALDAGDYIRWALNLGSSLDPASEAGGRCIRVAEFNTTLTVATVGTGAGTFSSTPSISTPAGDVVIAAICAIFVSGADNDWQSIGAEVHVGGSGALSSGVYGQYLMAGGATTWTPALSATDDWAARAVSYTAAAIEATNSPRDGNADLVGTDRKVARCDHRHDVHRDTEPTVDDDWATAGYKVGTTWAVVDDLDSPTEILSEWVLLDDATGAAVWWERTSGSPGGSGSLLFIGDPPSFAGGADKDFRGAGALTPYTATGATSGTVALRETSTSVNKYELTDAGLLVQPGNSLTGSFAVSYTLPDLQSIVLAATGAPVLQAGDNFSIGLRLTGPSSTFILCYLEQDTTEYVVQSQTSVGLLFEYTIPPMHMPPLMLFRICRDGLNYRAYVSPNSGLTWQYIGTQSFAAALTGVQLEIAGASSGQTRIPAGRFLFIVEGHGDDGYDPW